MLNFTVGPVQSSREIRMIAYEQIPYFRTPEFSVLMTENENLLKKLAMAPANARAVFITGSGTASMEAAIMNVFDKSDRILVINGGSFGQRFAELCKLHNLTFTEIRLEAGRALEEAMLVQYENAGYTGLLVNVHETSTGVRYDMEIISSFCKRNHIFLVADAISSFLADPFDMDALGVDVMITGSQKALACPPGISMIVLSPKAVERVYSHTCQSMYFDMKCMLEDGKRGQTPFTPAVGILLQINARLKEIDQAGGAEYEVGRVAALAEDFREKIADMPLEIISESLSNAVTPLHPFNHSTEGIVTLLKDRYQIWVCPNGGELADKVFRVGHIGSLTKDDNTTLVHALKDMQKKGLL